MGVDHLWEVLAPAATSRSLMSLALQNRFHGEPPFAPYRVGVDVSILFERCQQVQMLRAHPQSGQNAPLRTFFYRVTRLLKLPLQLVFCYDGDERPAFKRERRVSPKDHWMVKPTQRILNALGVPWFKARGEAEAELAAMNVAGVIDAVMTDDSDVFVFGAQTVIRNSSLEADGTVSVYTADSIRDNVAQKLDHDGLVLMALLCGGDYDMAGLVGCGSVTALGLVRCGLAVPLCTAMRTDSDLTGSLQEWRQKLREHLQSDPTREIGRQHPALASVVPDTFPSEAVAKSYIVPLVRAGSDQFRLPQPQPPDLGSTAVLARELFGWDDTTALLKTFRANVWPGFVLQELLQDLSCYSSSSNEVVLPPAGARAFSLHAVRSAKALDDVPGHNIRLPTATLCHDTVSRINSAEVSAPTGVLHDSEQGSPNSLDMWIAKSIYDSWIDLASLRTTGLRASAQSQGCLGATRSRSAGAICIGGRLPERESSKLDQDVSPGLVASSSAVDGSANFAGISEHFTPSSHDHDDIIDLTADDNVLESSSSCNVIDLTADDSPQSSASLSGHAEIIDLTL
ncbi:PIN domain-like protein [Hygrophoropsis aurantiaca]|uniref:PIN domain-like protein n=1 Tax=Hygrophoropsis aurantiaca TaxID=72124 RepID=A0ACB8ABB9_9AGAM|nr:PIN domain-like protein [Hygrophoropsis aurantiaca]